MEALATPITEAAKCSIPLLGRQIGYLLHCKRNLRNLVNKENDLVTMRSDVDRSVQTARDRGDLIKTVVVAWLAKVDTVRNEVMRLNAAAEAINSYFKGWCCKRYHLGKEAKENIGILETLLNEGNGFNSSNTVSDPAPIPGIEALPTGDFQEFESRDSAMKEIIEALKDDKIIVIGVYGMGGVGKTTLMKEVGKMVRRNELFDEVIMATVSQKPGLKNIQEDIAQNLGVKLEEHSTETIRAKHLSTSLKNRKRVLVILDDLWERLDLANVGIPLGDDHRGCKVVLTTRSRDVCGQMDAQKKIEIKGLSEQDSWNLFRQKAGDDVDSPSLQTSAREVVNECGGLPLALVTIGRALRDKDQYVWQDTARQLKKSICEGMTPVLASIKLSYDYLRNEVIKRCFLFCCFFPEDYNIEEEELMWYVMGEQMLRHVDTIEEARGRLHTLIDKLVSACLLLEGDKAGCIKMHDIVRDAALSIASEESNGFLVEAGLRLTRWPGNITLGTCKRVSLMSNKISKLPSQLECPRLLTLSLSLNKSLNELPDSFFESMTSLVTLNLERTAVSSLPPSLSLLVNLRMLRLDFTLVSDISMVGNLKKLEMLSLIGTLIKMLPKELMGLTNLKLLNLSKAWYLETIAKNVLLSFSHLQEFYMLEQNNFKGWETEGMGDGSKATLAELTSLNLTNLYLEVGDVKYFPNEISKCWENLTKCCINVGTRGSNWVSPYLKAMELVDLTSDRLPNLLKVLLGKMDHLYLDHCHLFKKISNLDAAGFVNLKYLQVEFCSGMECLVSLMEEENMVEEVHQTTTITSSSPPLFFMNLKHLKISSCPKLKYLFPMKVVLGLLQLQELEVSGSHEMEKIIVDDEDRAKTGGECNMILPNLKTLKLSSLSQLISIHQHNILFDWPSLEYLTVKYCPYLKKLPFGPQSAPRLREVAVDYIGPDEWFERLEWEDQSVKLHLRPLLRI